MKSISKTSNGILVTGSSGFIGQQLCRQLVRNGQAYLETREANVLDNTALQQLAREWRTQAIIHLAGYGRVVAPVSFAPAMFSTAIEGTLNVLTAFRPKVFILASTCAVYGDTGPSGAIAGDTPTKPLGLYGMSRTSCEQLATSWAIESGNVTVVMRFGNVIGPGCGGLIPYLVNHAIRYPDGDVPARLRGAGRIIRDYVPVSHVVRCLDKAATMDWRSVTGRTFNVGCGRGKTNGDVAALVRQIVGDQGYKLRIEFEAEPGHGESPRAILDVKNTTEALEIAAPTEDSVHDAIAAAVRDHMTQASPRASVAVAI